LERRYKSERVYFEERVKRTESLAAVGLSVEVSSHDIMLMFNKGMETLGALREDCCKKSFDISMLPKTLERLYGIFSYVRDKIKDMQLLFVSSKQTKHQIRVEEILNKVIRTYKSAYDDAGIQVDVIKKGSPLVASCTDADLLQILINLFDNSLYWLTTVERDCRLVSISMDGDTGQLIFSDNGPGIRDDDAPYVFDAFFSGKGQKGRGMGLYISRQIMERNDYSIRLAEYSDEKILEGANFVVSFVKQEDD
jgi:signal transduction histidine kinase